MAHPQHPAPANIVNGNLILGDRRVRCSLTPVEDDLWLFGWRQGGEHDGSESRSVAADVPGIHSPLVQERDDVVA